MLKGNFNPEDPLEVGRNDVAALVRFAQAMAPVTDEKRFLELAKETGTRQSPEMIMGFYDAFRAEQPPLLDPENIPEEPILVD